jgi:hypothetical protein
MERRIDHTTRVLEVSDFNRNEFFNLQHAAYASMILPCDARSNAAHGTLADEENHGSARASELE